MADDLTARLRHMALIGASSEMGDGYLTHEEVVDLRAAAARIRELEAALRYTAAWMDNTTINEFARDPDGAKVLALISRSRHADLPD